MDRLFTCHHVVHIGVQNNETAVSTKTKFSGDWTRFSCLNFRLDPRNQLHSCWQSKRKRSISTEIWLALLTDQKHFNPFIFYKKQSPKSQFKSRKVLINAYHIEQLIGKTTTLHVHRLCTFRCHHCTTTKRKCIISCSMEDFNKHVPECSFKYPEQYESRIL